VRLKSYSDSDSAILQFDPILIRDNKIYTVNTKLMGIGQPSRFGNTYNLNAAFK